MPEVISKTKRSESVDLRPKFTPPKNGGRYVLDPDDNVPVFLEGTSQKQTPAEKAKADKILGKAKPAAQSNSEKAK